MYFQVFLGDGCLGNMCWCIFRCFWGMVCLVGMSMFVFMLISLILKYYEYPVIVRVDQVSKQFYISHRGGDVKFWLQNYWRRYLSYRYKSENFEQIILLTQFNSLVKFCSLTNIKIHSSEGQNLFLFPQCELVISLEVVVCCRLMLRRIFPKVVNVVATETGIKARSVDEKWLKIDILVVAKSADIKVCLHLQSKERSRERLRFSLHSGLSTGLTRNVHFIPCLKLTLCVSFLILFSSKNIQIWHLLNFKVLSVYAT